MLAADGNRVATGRGRWQKDLQYEYDLVDQNISMAAQSRPDQPGYYVWPFLLGPGPI